MNQNKFETILRTTTPTARKVFDAVPISESWSPFQIGAELQRLGTPKQRDIVEGCLKKLTADGLVYQEPRTSGLYRRTEVRANHEEKAQVMNIAAVPKTNPAIKPGRKPEHMERLSALSERIRSVSHVLKILADDVDAAAIAIDEEVVDISADTLKLRQLQTLLKELT